MVFSSYPFILFFLPAVVLMLLILRRFKRNVVMLALVGASLVFYGYWDWRFVWVILLSITVNYGVGLTLGQAGRAA